jgi:hypothetical protein
MRRGERDSLYRRGRNNLSETAQLLPARDFLGIPVTAQGSSIGIGHCPVCRRGASSGAAGHAFFAEEVG